MEKTDTPESQSWYNQVPIVFFSVSSDCLRIFYVFLQIYATRIMKNNTPNESRKDYQIPSLRFIETNLETSFLQSNLEPIDGGNDPDIDW